MKQYEIAVRVEAWYYVNVEAESEEDAIDQAKEIDIDEMVHESNYIEDYEVVYAND
jgi:hypothetical protein